jgi:hypothetical protein
MAGDVYKPEDLFPIVDETDTVDATGLSLRTPAGRFDDVIRVTETTRFMEPRETKWYAPGIGVVRGRTKGERFALVASTLSGP